jgi:predicted TIM-barrel fold metal-dependent hydrolase
MLIDCDVHQNFPPGFSVVDFLDEPYRSEVAEFGPRRISSGIRFEDGGMRRDAIAPDGRQGGKDPGWTAEHLMDTYGHRYALLTGEAGMIAGIPDPGYASAICTAWNRMTHQCWLPADRRYLTGVKIALQDPAGAAREIEQWAGHPRVVCALASGNAHRIPFGQSFYWPVYEACARHGLPLHIHPATTAALAAPATGASGVMTNYLQGHACLPQFFQSDLISMVLEGVFEKFPGLKVVMVEGGFAWLPHVVWRMDKEFKALRQQAPFLRRLPSEYVRDHVKLTTQPIEEPLQARHLPMLLDLMEGDRALMYASDYPHYDFDEPSVLPRGLSEETRRRILHDNAAEFFPLPKESAE